MHELALCQAIVRHRRRATPTGGASNGSRCASATSARSCPTRSAVLVGAADRRHRARRLRARRRPRARRRRVPRVRRARRRSTCRSCCAAPATSSDVDAGERRGVPDRVDRPSPGGLLMGRFHRHADGTVHDHDHDHADARARRTSIATSATTAATPTPASSASRCSRPSSPRTTAPPTATGPTSPPPVWSR